jgi:hypothetical protein
MVKVLIYSSKKIYDNASYEGRAEAHLIAYRKDNGYYEVTKNKIKQYLGSQANYALLRMCIEFAERDEWDREFAAAQDAHGYMPYA